MNQDQPQAYGVFKPVGHVVAAFPPDADEAGAVAALGAAGLEITQRYSPEQMAAQAKRNIEDAGVLAGIGQELNLVKTHRELALAGSSFLVIRTPGSEQAREAGDIVGRHGASRAQHYSRWMIEELLPVGTTSRQVNESPDSGLDQQTRSGRPAVT
jgi:hypothetical protein